MRVYVLTLGEQVAEDTTRALHWTNIGVLEVIIGLKIIEADKFSFLSPLMQKFSSA